jgi:ABC-type polysaccharide/polyol phosphate transport system ATPase subunit
MVQAVCNKVLVLDAGHATFFGPTHEWLNFRAAA